MPTRTAIMRRKRRRRRRGGCGGGQSMDSGMAPLRFHLIHIVIRLILPPLPRDASHGSTLTAPLHGESTVVVKAVYSRRRGTLSQSVSGDSHPCAWITGNTEVGRQDA